MEANSNTYVFVFGAVRPAEATAPEKQKAAGIGIDALRLDFQALTVLPASRRTSPTTTNTELEPDRNPGRNHRCVRVLTI